MIDRAEILELAEEWGLPPRTVEKDYVLGWVLAGIFQRAKCAAAWVFKGGTCLKKCYFETYRFSEDLDFTVVEAEQMDEVHLRSVFTEIAGWVYEQAGIEIPANQLRFDVFENPRGGLSCEGRLYYRGPIAPRGDLPRIKVDLTVDELVVLEPAWRPVSHPYSDAPADGMRARCYPFEEIFAEKLRALGERCRPRDLYDVVNLHHRPEAQALARPVLSVLEKKCEFKGVAVPNEAMVRARASELEAEWHNMLAHQLPFLPPANVFLGAMAALFSWLAGEQPAVAPPPMPAAKGELVLMPALRSMGFRGSGAAPLETIRFAAANHLCVDLDYVDAEGHRSVRRIEPYSLRRTQDSAVLLHAERAGGRGHRSYRVERIRGASVTDQPFNPRWAIELSPSRAPDIRPAASRAVLNAFAPGYRARRAAGQATYVYECPLCGKMFRHSTRNATLRDHKAPDGRPCRGRRGVLREVLS